jgi:hypothetical protein
MKIKIYTFCKINPAILYKYLYMYLIFLFYIFYIHIVKTHPFLGNLPPLPRFVHIIVQNKGISFTKYIEFDFHICSIILMMAV